MLERKRATEKLKQIKKVARKIENGRICPPPPVAVGQTHSFLGGPGRRR